MTPPIPPLNLNQDRFQPILDDWRERGYSPHRLSATGSHHATFTLRNTKDGADKFGKISALKTRREVQARADRGERLISLLPPDPRINTISTRCFYGNGKSDEILPDSQHMVEVSPFIGGTDLFNYILNNPPLPFEKALKWSIEIGEILAHFHEQGVIYRDLKLENIIVDEKEQLHLVDFEYAKKMEQAPLSPVGTELYISPEMLNIPFQTKSNRTESELGDCLDNFAFGLIIFNIFTQSYLFENIEDIRRYSKGIYKPDISIGNSSNGDVRNPSVEKVISGLLELNLAKRMKAKDAVAALKQI